MKNVTADHFKFHSIRKRIRKSYFFINEKFAIVEELRNRLIYVNPQKINLMHVAKNFDYPVRELSGAVVEDNFFSGSLIPLKLHPKIRYCTAHWGYGNSWEESGALDYYHQMFRRFDASNAGFDKMRNIGDVYHRLSILDEIYLESKKSASLKTRHQLNLSPNKLNEKGGILVHFDSKNNVILGGGFHRLAIAKILGLEYIPAVIGLVSHKSLPFVEGNLV